MSNSENGTTTSKCFSGVLRRLLCTGSLPTYPSDVIPESINTTKFDHPEKELKFEEKKAQASTPAPAGTPGIVARLMGLDSMPDIINWPPKQSTSYSLDSILRSRSVNFLDFYLPKFDLIAHSQHHPRVKTSSSFREVPTFLQLQDHDHRLFVPCFEKMSLNVGESDMGLEEFKQKRVKTERISRENLRERQFEKNKKVCKEEEPKNRVFCKSSSSSSSSLVGNHVLPGKNKVVHRQKTGKTSKAKTEVKPINQKERRVESKVRSKKESRFKANSENSSPVSVLDLQNTLIHQENASPEESRVKLVSNSREKCSSNAAYYNNPSISSTGNFIVDDHHHHVVKAKVNRDAKAVKTEDHVEVVSQICRWTEEELKESDWITNKQVLNYDEDVVEEIYTEFGQQILDLLFHKVIDELLGNSNMRSL